MFFSYGRQKSRYNLHKEPVTSNKKRHRLKCLFRRVFCFIGPVYRYQLSITRNCLSLNRYAMIRRITGIKKHYRLFRIILRNNFNFIRSIRNDSSVSSHENQICAYRITGVVNTRHFKRNAFIRPDD